MFANMIRTLHVRGCVADGKTKMKCLEFKRNYVDSTTGWNRMFLHLLTNANARCEHFRCCHNNVRVGNNKKKHRKLWNVGDHNHVWWFRCCSIKRMNWYQKTDGPSPLITWNRLTIHMKRTVLSILVVLFNMKLKKTCASNYKRVNPSTKEPRVFKTKLTNNIVKCLSTKKFKEMINWNVIWCIDIVSQHCVCVVMRSRAICCWRVV